MIDLLVNAVADVLEAGLDLAALILGLLRGDVSPATPRRSRLFRRECRRWTLHSPGVRATRCKP